jgi:hypothetical protein
MNDLIQLDIERNEHFERLSRKRLTCAPLRAFPARRGWRSRACTCLGRALVAAGEHLAATTSTVPST